MQVYGDLKLHNIITQYDCKTEALQFKGLEVDPKTRHSNFGCINTQNSNDKLINNKFETLPKRKTIRLEMICTHV